ncbi:MAG: hypothetical protein JWP34_4959 [Massilia sp.]|nr:hypothetical protein [Massilia sp.]
MREDAIETQYDDWTTIDNAPESENPDMSEEAPAPPTLDPNRPLGLAETQLYRSILLREPSEWPSNAEVRRIGQRHVEYALTSRQELAPQGHDEVVAFYGIRDRARERYGTLPGPLYPEEDPLLDAAHDRHSEVFWAACFDDRCILHYDDKTEHDFFPRKKGVVTEAYTTREMSYFEELAKMESQGALIFVYNREQHPRGCLVLNQPFGQNDIYTCASTKCAKHQDEKLEEWHRIRHSFTPNQKKPRRLTTTLRPSRRQSPKTMDIIRKETKEAKNAQDRL